MDVDYKKLGFKAGLEIHQQLDTGKLFCSCPGILRDDAGIFEVKRKLHPVLGESGEIDVAAKFQHLEDKEFIYRAHDTTCLVELDEEPPQKINEDALFIALQIAELLNCKIIPISQVMRKAVIDGSNTSGFQRTVLYAKDGYVETSLGKVKINFIFLEEDSARKIKEDGNKVYWNLDRLGLPLVEVVTAPDIKNSKHAKETALLIGNIIRSCKVRRGIGTIRQDINISIKGTNRVEIKGFQDPKIMEVCVDNEILRQKGLLEISKIIPKFVNSKIKIFDLDVDLDWMKKEFLKDSKFTGFKLKNWKGFLSKELFLNYRLGTDLSNYAKSRGFGGLIHGDEDLIKKYRFSFETLEKIKNIFELEENDSFIMVLGDSLKAQKMFEEILIPRISILNKPNPSEVRNCLNDGTTSFLRPMPGSARMYPETDLNLLKISRELINRAKKNLPETRQEILNKLKKEGLNEDMINILFNEDKLEEFKEIVNQIEMPFVVGKTLLLLPKEIAIKLELDLNYVREKLNVDVLIFVLEKLKENYFEEGDLKKVLEKIVRGEDAEKAIILEKIDNSKVESFIAKLIKEKPGLRPNAYMGIVMKEFGGSVKAGEIMKIIEKILK